MERELAGGARARRVTLLDRGPRWRLMSLLAALLVVAAGVATVTVWLTGRGGRSPEETARLFLESTSCSELHRLADSQGDAKLGGGGCQALIDAARGRRTYRDPRADRQLTRSLSVGDAVIDGDRAEVTVTVSYTEDGRRLEPEQIGVVLMRDDEWLVSAWGPRE